MTFFLERQLGMLSRLGCRGTATSAGDQPNRPMIRRAGGADAAFQSPPFPADQEIVDSRAEDSFAEGGAGVAEAFQGVAPGLAHQVIVVSHRDLIEIAGDDDRRGAAVA